MDKKKIAEDFVDERIEELNDLKQGRVDTEKVIANNLFFGMGISFMSGVGTLCSIAEIATGEVVKGSLLLAWDLIIAFIAFRIAKRSSVRRVDLELVRTIMVGMGVGSDIEKTARELEKKLKRKYTVKERKTSQKGSKTPKTAKK